MYKQTFTFSAVNCNNAIHCCQRHCGAIGRTKMVILAGDNQLSRTWGAYGRAYTSFLPYTFTQSVFPPLCLSVVTCICDIYILV